MKERRFNRVLAGAFVVLLAISFIGASNSPACAAPIELKAVVVLPLRNVQVEGFKLFVDRVNEKLRDQVKINILGGPEVVPPFQLAEAVAKGVTDMCLTSSSYYANVLPESEAVMFSNLPALQAREIIYDKMVELHEKVGFRYLGDTLRCPMVLFINKPVKGINDLNGKKIRVFPGIIPFVKSLGAVPVNLPMGEIYSAMDRGVVDGFVKSVFGIVKNEHFNEVTKYVIVHGFYAGSLNVLVNLKKWNEIPKNLQERIVEINDEVYPEICKHYDSILAGDWKDILDSGIKPINLPKVDTNVYLNKAYETGWERIIEKSPTLGPQLKTMIFKKFE